MRALPCLALSVSRELKLRSLHLDSQHFTHGAISSSPGMMFVLLLFYITNVSNFIIMRMLSEGHGFEVL